MGVGHLKPLCLKIVIFQDLKNCLEEKTFSLKKLKEIIWDVYVLTCTTLIH